MSAIFGIYAPGEEVGRITYFALKCLEHRGNEGAGIGVIRNGERVIFKEKGIVSQVFSEKWISLLAKGEIGIGQVSSSDLIGPYEKDRMIFASGENLFLNFEDADFISSISASLLVAEKGKLIGIRGGRKPLYLAKEVFKNQFYFAFATEIGALKFLRPKQIKELNYGEGFIISEKGIRRLDIKLKEKKICSFEFIFFSRPDNLIEGKLVEKVRRKLGILLAAQDVLEGPSKVDLVVSVPYSGDIFAEGYARLLDLPLYRVVKNPHIISNVEPHPKIRNRDLRYAPIEEFLQGKRVVVVDDSIISGNKIKEFCQMLRERKVREIHLRIASPIVRSHCLDEKRKQLLGEKNERKIKEILKVNSIRFLSISNLKKGIGLKNLCLDCFKKNEF